jgi:aryl-alcohol dehydrogenase-like predicted oxidoreductase
MRLVFGAGGLHRLAFKRQRQGILKDALDAGFRAFDVAPAYGNGLNECELGDALAGVRADCRIATKFGIPVELYGERHPRLFLAMRASAKLRGSDAGAYARRRFDPEEMQASLEGSLRRLRRDHVDDFLIHEPLRPLTAAEHDALHERAERLRREGKIVAWGIAGPVGSMGDLVHDPRVEVVQFPLDDPEPAPGTRRRIAYGVFRSYLRHGPAEPFPQWFRARAARSPGLEFVLSTRSRATLRELASLLS